MRKLVNKLSYLAGRGSGLFLLVVLWEVAPRAGLVDGTFLSPPSAVINAFFKLYLSGDLWVHLSSSLKRSLVGLLIAILLGTGLGIFLGWFKRFEYVLDPVFQTFRQMSAFALFPVFILFFGIGEVSKTVIIFWASLWPILLNTINGVKNVEQLLIDSAKSMGASQSFIFLKVVLPAAAPGIFTGIRLGGAYSILALVAAEMIGADAGLGFLVLYSQETFNIPEMYAAIVGLALVGLGLNYALTFLEARVTGWKNGSSTSV